MTNLVVAPLLIPLLGAMLMMFVPHNIRVQKGLAVATAVLMLVASLLIVDNVSQHGIQVLYLGDWEAPFGIVLAADMLAALLVTASAVVTLACLLYAFGDLSDGHQRHYVYPFILILAAGVNGSFLTGDLFNLFVCFEVMLVASYVLISLGGQRAQLRESIKYIVVNMVSSTLFFAAIAYMYSITGTLNMAHLAQRVAEAGQDGLMTTVGLLFLIVFATKSALFLFFWLPGSYVVPPAPVAALFAALLTKVGVYTILRMFTLIFYHQPQITHQLLLWLAAITMILGALGAISHWDVRKVLAYNIIVSVGFIVVGVGVLHPAALAGSLYYLLHDMIVKALLYIIGGAVIAIAGTSKLREIKGLIRFRPALGWLFFIAVLAVAGVPPLSGFVGKLLILQGGVEQQFYGVVAVGLATSFLALYSLLKVFIQSFWGDSLLSEGEEKSTGTSALLPSGLLVLLVVGMGLGAEWVLEYVQQAAAVMVDPSLYIEAVLGQPAAVGGDF